MRFLLLSASLLFTSIVTAADRTEAIVSTVAGVPGLPGFDNGSARYATFNRPTWVDFARNTDSCCPLNARCCPGVKAGDIFVIDRANQSIRLISGEGVSTYSVARLLPPQFVLEPVAFDFGGPFGGGIVVEPPRTGCGGGVYAPGMFVVSSGTGQIAWVSMDALLAERDNGSAVVGTFNRPTGVTLSWNYASVPPYERWLYFADTGSHTIRRISFKYSFLGCPQFSYSDPVRIVAGLNRVAGGEDGVSALARFNSPLGVAAGPDGNIYVADSGNHAIRRVTPDGVVTTIAGELGIAGSNDGTGRDARLNTPSGIDVNAKGEIFFTDTGNHAVRMITTDGSVVTIAGTLGLPGFADGPALTAKFAGPVGLRITPDGSLLIADTSNNVIRRYSVVTVVDRRRSVRR